MGTERRVEPRYELMALISVRQADATFILKIRDISRSGVFVETESQPFLESLQIGSTVEMNLFQSGDLKNTRLEGLVVRVIPVRDQTPGGFAVGFQELPAETWQTVLGMAKMTGARVQSAEALAS